MKSTRALAEWTTWKTRLDAALSLSAALIDPADAASLRFKQDTVGAIAWDAFAGLAAGVSRYQTASDLISLLILDTVVASSLNILVASVK